MTVQNTRELPPLPAQADEYIGDKRGDEHGNV